MKWKEVMWCLILLEFHVFHLCESTKTASKMGGEVSEKSLKVSNEVVEEAGVKHTGVFLLRSKGEYGEVAASVDNYERLSSFCYKGLKPSLPHFWSSASLKLELDGTDYQVYIGSNLTAVARLAQESETAWIYTQLPWRSKDFKLSPFEDICIGVQTSQKYKMTLQWKHVNYLFLLATLAGLVLFCMAPTLCRNTFFHYTTGIGVGLLLSVLLLTFLVQRKLKQSLFSWIGVFYSLSVYLMTRTWFNIKEWLTTEYYHWVIIYVLGAGVVSFAVIYRLGPPSNPRTLNLIQWAMQLAGLATVVLSSYHQAASLLVAILLLSWAAIPGSVKSSARTVVIKTFFRPEHKLLSEEEFITQGVVETRKALEELKEYCRSPESKPWQTVRKLQSPVRFAEFIEGSPHLTEAEVMEYSHFDYNTTDDEEDDEDEILTDDEEAEDAGRD